MAATVPEELAVSQEALNAASNASDVFRQLTRSGQYQIADLWRTAAVANFEASLDAFTRACRLCEVCGGPG